MKSCSFFLVYALCHVEIIKLTLYNINTENCHKVEPVNSFSLQQKLGSEMYDYTQTFFCVLCGICINLLAICVPVCCLVKSL